MATEKVLKIDKLVYFDTGESSRELEDYLQGSTPIRPIIVAADEKTVLDGGQMVAAAKRLGWTEIRAIIEN